MKEIEEKSKLLINCDEFNKTMNSFDISKKVLNFAREKYRVFLIEAKELQKKPRIKKLDKQSVHCNLQWPICSMVMENAKINKPEIDFFIFKQGYPNHLILHEDYFDSKEEFKPGRKKIPFINMKDNLVIGRYEHCCVNEEEKKIEEKKIKKISFEQNNTNSGKNHLIY